MNIQFVIMPDHPLGGASVYVSRSELPGQPHRAFYFESNRRADGEGRVKVMLGTSLKQQGYETACYKPAPRGDQSPVFRCLNWSVWIPTWDRK